MKLKFFNKKNKNKKFNKIKKSFLALFVINIILSFLILKKNAQQVPIFYTLTPDERKLANQEFIFILPVIGILFSIINLGVLKYTKTINKNIYNIFIYLTILLNIIITLILLRLEFII